MSYYTRNEVAKLFRVNPRTVERWLKKGVLRGYKLGDEKTSIIRIPNDAVEEFLRKSKIKKYGK